MGELVNQCGLMLDASLHAQHHGACRLVHALQINDLIHVGIIADALSPHHWHIHALRVQTIASKITPP